MNLLALDTTGERLTLALETEGRVRARRASAARDADEALPGELERLLRAASLALPKIDAVVAATGPGRFTGIRVGLTFAGVLARALGKRAVGVSWLEAAAWRSAPEPGRLVAVVTGWKEELFFQAFERDAEGIRALAAPGWADPASFAAAAGALGADARWVGPGARRAIELLAGPALAEACEPLEARDLLVPARRRLAAGTLEPLAPLYVKPAHYER